jgi:hypothetical protein
LSAVQVGVLALQTPAFGSLTDMQAISVERIPGCQAEARKASWK